MLFNLLFAWQQPSSSTWSAFTLSFSQPRSIWSSRESSIDMQTVYNATTQYDDSADEQQRTEIEVHLSESKAANLPHLIT